MSKIIPPQRKKELLTLLEKRFEKFPERHLSIQWKDVLKKIGSDDTVLWTLNEMEESGGEPDVIAYKEENGKYVFCDCSAESPKGRRSVCYDQEALDARKAHKTEDNAISMCREMGIKLLTEQEYRYLQTLGDFDTKTSSWIETPEDIRSLGGALFGDRRFGHVFIYHNGAESYYGARGFRGLLEV
jgi:hypothetical protein